MRSTATQEAAALMERARADAEAHRHDVEQSLITRAAALDQEATARRVELDERERQIDEQVAAAREEAEQIRSAAKRDAEQLHRDAEARIEERRTRAEKIMRRQRETAEQELRRVRALYDGVRGDLTRLHELLAGELDSTAEKPTPRPHPTPSPRAVGRDQPSTGGHDRAPGRPSRNRGDRQPFQDRGADPASAKR